MYGSDVDSINVDLEFFQSGDILTVPLLHLAPNQDERESQGDNEQKIGPVWELAQLGFWNAAGDIRLGRANIGRVWKPI